MHASRHETDWDEPAMAAYRSPWPGGHHSCAAAAAQLAGCRLPASTLGTLF